MVVRRGTELALFVPMYLGHPELTQFHLIEAVKESKCSPPHPFYSTVPPPDTLTARFGGASSRELHTFPAVLLCYGCVFRPEI